MKHWISLILAAALLLGAVLFPSARAEDAFRFTRENFPTLDGSTSLVPLGQAIASVLLGESREDAADLIHFNRTTQSFRNLCDGYCDIVIAAEPKADVFNEMRKAAFPYLMETIAKEALVFVVNESNPVDSLTASQLRDIYAGNITNWQEVGGEDMPIVAFQRNATAGSQVMMEKLVMDGTPMMEAPTTQIPAEMAGLIDAVKSYDNSANAIGYTVFYYAADMQMAKGLKIIAVDGIAPTPETIRSEEYPYINGYYCCISANQPIDSPARRLYDWLISGAGQRLLNLEGYVAVSTAGTAETDGADVVTDYTHYAPTGCPAAKFTYFDCTHQRLEASDQYGMLYAYKGPNLYNSWHYEGVYYDYMAGSQWGLFTHDGQLVTDPVFTTASLNVFPDNGDLFWHLALDEGHGCIASPDGSFVSDYVYEEIYPMGSWIVAIRDLDASTFDLYDHDFRIVKTQEDFPYQGAYAIPYECGDGKYACRVNLPEDDYAYLLMDENGNVLLDSHAYIMLYSDGIVEYYNEDWNATIYTPDMQPIVFDGLEAPASISRLTDHFFDVRPEDGEPFIADRMGNRVLWDYNYTNSTGSDSFTLIRDGEQRFYDARGRLLATCPGNDWVYLADNILYEYAENGLNFRSLPDDKTLFVPDGSYAWMMGDRICISCYSFNSASTSRIADKNLNLLPQVFDDFSSITDPYTGREYLRSANGYLSTSHRQLWDVDTLEVLFDAMGSIEVNNGYFSVWDDRAYTCYDPQGEIIFCYPYYGMSTGD